MDEAVCENLQKTLSKNQLKNISIKNDTITGTTNYEKDGYTMLSLAYDKGWSAYIDGKKVAVENPYDAGIYIKTPAGKHTLTLKFEPYDFSMLLDFNRSGIRITASDQTP